MFSKMKIRPFMKNLYDDMPNGYQKTINQGLAISQTLIFFIDKRIRLIYDISK